MITISELLILVKQENLMVKNQSNWRNFVEHLVREKFAFDMLQIKSCEWFNDL